MGRAEAAREGSALPQAQIKGMEHLGAGVEAGSPLWLPGAL